MVVLIILHFYQVDGYTQLYRLHFALLCGLSMVLLKLEDRRPILTRKE